jgi:hypothetical protein
LRHSSFPFFSIIVLASPTNMKSLLEERRKKMGVAYKCWPIWTTMSVNMLGFFYYTNCHNAVKKPSAILSPQEGPPNCKTLRTNQIFLRGIQFL